ncbi:hypothetical protein ARAM_007255 [Aspergillus rambellii]|uniref:SAM-dependent methyltransferase n=1 Tax=Aspergillus rambellii TaxID=308745 RepID=A0A0F8UY45_9EURO|nr:hypothetical protein ARAM_007255 [Aspergillus rambellii]
MSSDWTEKNRQTFEKMSRSYRADFAEGLKILFKTVQAKRGWASDIWTDTEAGKGREIKMLEYACGPGMVSMALAPFVTRIIGMDVSDGMVDEFNKNAQEEGMSDKMVGIKADLLGESVPAEISGPEFYDFDVIVVSMALHHFQKPELAMSRLAERLKKGGVLIIIDIIPEHQDDKDNGLRHVTPSEVAETIHRHGFSQEDMNKLYGDAGFATGFKYQVIEEPLVFKKGDNVFHRTIFMARAEL